MTTLRIDTEDKKILKAVRAILETFEVPFEEARSDSPYDPEFVKKIEKSLHQAGTRSRLTSMIYGDKPHL